MKSSLSRSAKVTVSLDAELVRKVDRLVQHRVFPNRSQAVAAALREKVQRLDRNRLARECKKLNPQEEQSLAEEGWAAEADAWPEY